MTAEQEKQNATTEMTRKPCSWAEVRESAVHYKELREALPVLKPQEVYGRPDTGPMGELKENTPQWFILRRKDADYLINTEGYNYARYALRLKPEDDMEHADVNQIIEGLDIAKQCLDDLIAGRPMTFKGNPQEALDKIEQARQIFSAVQDIPCMACGKPEPCGCGAGR